MKMREAECVVSIILHKRGGDAYMLMINTCLLFIYILFFLLVLVTIIAVALFIALMVMIRKLDKKNTSLLGR